MNVKNPLALFFFSFLPLQTFAHNPEAKATGDGSILGQYSFLEKINPLFLLSLVVVYIVYLWAMRKVSNQHSGERYLKKKISFLLGLLAVYFSLAGPVSILSNNLIFSVHMFQQSLMYIVMPPLILVGMPHEFYQFLDVRLYKSKIIRIFKSPIIGLLLFNVLWSLYHIPTIYEYVGQHLFLLEASHLVINASAFLMWVHVLAPAGLINKMSYLMKIGYMFANGILITPACALIIFAPDVAYPTLYEVPQLFSFSTPQDDQQLGGIIMKTVQEISYGVTIAYVFFKWAKLERKKDTQIDALPISAIE